MIISILIFWINTCSTKSKVLKFIIRALTCNVGVEQRVDQKYKNSFKQELKQCFDGRIDKRFAVWYNDHRAFRRRVHCRGKMNIGKKQAHMGQDLVCACLNFLRIISKSHKKIRFLLSIYSESTLVEGIEYWNRREKRGESIWNGFAYSCCLFFWGFWCCSHVQHSLIRFP